MKAGGSKRGLLIRADAGNTLGIGHVMRSLALASAWRQANRRRVVFVSHSTISELYQYIQNEGIAFILLPQLHPDPSDLVQTLVMAKSGDFEWVLLDGYHFDPAYQKAIRDTGCRLLVIDDVAHHTDYHADIVLNQNINAGRLKYRYDFRTSLFLLGPDYCLLRKGFLAWQNWKRDIPDSGDKILVTVGGSDPNNQILKVLRALMRLKGQTLEVVAIVNENSPYLKELHRAVHGLNWIRLTHAVMDMPELMAWADVAVSGGGITCWEMAFMGLPNLILTLADNQRPTAFGLHEAGVSWNLGWWETVTEEQICHALKSLLSDPIQRAEMSQRGRQLVDGKGVERVVAVMEGFHESIPTR